MLFFSLRKLVGVTAKQRKLNRRRRPLVVDVLEDRRLLAVLTVDDDKAQNHQAQFTTISAAVAAANAGDTIKVSPGTYNESVLINKTLSILGAQEVDGKNNNAPNATNPLRASIVEVPIGGLAGFDLRANDIVIRGFTIQDSDANAPLSVGIRTNVFFSGYTIEKNVIQDTRLGIQADAGSVAPAPIHATTIRNNLVRDNKGMGDAMFGGIVSVGMASNVVIQQNYITGQTFGSIILSSASPTVRDSNLTVKENTVDAEMSIVNSESVRVINNTSTNAGSGGIFLSGVTNAEIKNNKLTNVAANATAIGIQLVAQTSNVQIANNKISGFAMAGIEVVSSDHIVLTNNDLKGNASGIRLESDNSSTVQNNHIESNTGVGIFLMDSSENTISKNDVKKNTGDGISLVSTTPGASTGNIVDHNNLESNGTPAVGMTPAVGAGIHADANSRGNTFNQNEAKKNAFFDYQDESTGGGSAGTANTWTKNHGKTQNRPGLISK